MNNKKFSVLEAGKSKIEALANLFSAESQLPQRCLFPHCILTWLVGTRTLSRAAFIRVLLL